METECPFQRLIHREKHFFWPRREARGILVPRPGIKLASPALEAQSLNHWTAREVPGQAFLIAHVGPTGWPGSYSQYKKLCILLFPSCVTFFKDFHTCQLAGTQALVFTLAQPKAPAGPSFLLLVITHGGPGNTKP